MLHVSFNSSIHKDRFNIQQGARDVFCDVCYLVNLLNILVRMKRYLILTEMDCHGRLGPAFNLPCEKKFPMLSIPMYFHNLMSIYLFMLHDSLCLSYIT